MKAKYGIPQEDLNLCVERDKACVYCRKDMVNPWSSNNKSDSVTIEHLNHRQDWDSVASYIAEGKPIPEIIAICCGACNSSRGSLSLLRWFETSYCMERSINYRTVSGVVRNYIDQYEKSCYG